MNSDHTARARILHSKGFSYRDIASLLGHKADDVYVAIHGRKRTRQHQTPRQAVEELLADGCDPKVIEANFGRVA